MTPSTASSIPDDPGAEIDSIAAQLCELEDWPGAVQMKAQAGALALQAGRSDLFDQRYHEAAALAAAHDLPYLELSVRLKHAQFQLTSARAGSVIDSIYAEARSGDGELSQRIRQYTNAALATCAAIDSALAAPTPDSAILLAAVDAAALAATRFELHQTSGLLSDWHNEKGQPPFAGETLSELRAISVRLRGDLENRRAALLTEADILRSSLKAVFGDFDSQIDILTWALPAAANLPSALAQVYMGLADGYSSRAALEKTISPQSAAADLELAEQSAANAVAAVAPLGNLLDKDAPAAKLQEVRDLRQPHTATAAPGFYGAMALRQAAIQALTEHRPADALALLEQAAQSPAASLSPTTALGVRAAAYYELGRFAEAIPDLDSRISQLEQLSQADAGEFSYAFDRRLEELQNLYLIKACALTHLGRPTDAWDASERGRTALSDHPATWEAWRAWLQSERAAFVSFAISRWGVLVLSAAPDDLQPSATLLPTYRYSDLAPQLLNRTQEDSKAWTSLIFETVPELSERLLRPIQPILERAAAAEVLYILPDAYLFRAPFPALSFADGRFLNDLCPLATAPSAAFVLAGAAAVRNPAQSCLVVGVGQTDKDKLVVRFSDQARAIADLWTAPRSYAELFDAAATAAAVRDAANSADVLHLSCHGSASSQVLDPMAASQLALADRSVTAREALAWPLRADLVFMNVCQGGRFRMEGRTNVSGFLRAFHTAGARSVIASVTHIDPFPAGELALRFYRNWFTGITKARALQRARQEVRQLYPAPEDWASHALTGDHR